MTARARWRVVWAACAAAACVVTAACGGGGRPSAVGTPGAAGTGGSATPDGQASPTGSGATQSATAPDSAAPGGGDPASASASACVTQVLGSLTLAQRVGQLFLVAVDGNKASELGAAEHTYHFGSVLLNKSAAGTAALAVQTTALQELAASGTGGVGFFIAANQEGGEIQQLTGRGFATMPTELEQGTWTTARLRTAAAGWGTDLRAAGVNLDLAPVMDVVPAASAAGNAPIGALDRDYGSDPAVNGEHGAAFIEGMASAGVMSVAKHFPGLGRVTGNTDFTANVVDNVTTADDPYLNSFRGAVGAGVPMVMVASATYTKIDPTQLAAFSPAVMRLLRDGLGFTGVIVSDDLGDAVAVQSVTPGNRAVRFLSAGGDLVTSQSLAPAEQMAAAVLARASGNAAFRATVDDAAQRVLDAKQAAGLLSC
jgi:beta-N-acetylhexosaminidase